MEALVEPSFRASQIVQATTAAKSFGSIRKQAHSSPVLVMDRGKADVVIVNYDEYSHLYESAIAWREAQIDAEAANRLANHVPIGFDPMELALIEATKEKEAR